MVGLRGTTVVLGALAFLSLLAGALSIAASEPLIAALSVLAGFGLLTVLVRERRIDAIAARETRAAVAAMRRIAGGHFSVRTREFTSSTLSGLQAPFAAMAEALAVLFAQLADHRGQLTAVLDTMADGVILVDPENRVALSNRAAHEVLAIEATTGTPLSSILRDHELRGLVTLCRQSGARQHAELLLLSPRRSLSATATPIVNEPGEADAGEPEVSVLLTLHDLTPIRQLETTRREFVANVSHELRNPLASVKAMVETLEGGAATDPVAASDFLQRINREVDRMNAMVNDLLELSRIESGQSGLRRQPVDAAATIAAVRTDMEHRIAETEVAVTVNAPGSVVALGDSEKLRQVVANLLDNALKFTPSGGTIELYADDLEQDRVLFGVRDSGPGIAPEHLPHLFERFYKADRSRRDQGTGLGLAIAKHIVELHGGEIGVESTQGAGSTFWFTLPRAA
ncbi:MAG: ATP-binding protein [Chloroflexota bacterium]|nr:ATP-binding protein [Chloroflexota bacterium]MDE2884423.1 ATP-binding protein [Chloroflexota bacterium]